MKNRFSHTMFSMDIWGKKIGKVGNDYVPELVSSEELKSDILSQCTKHT